MCHCNSAGDYFADPLYGCPAALEQIVEANARAYPLAFSSEMLNARESDFESRDGRFFHCKECEAEWYLEWPPEEANGPIFGVRVEGAYQGSEEKIRAAKSAVLTSLLGGLSTSLCACSGCTNLALKHSYLCAEHYGFPW